MSVLNNILLSSVSALLYQNSDVRANNLSDRNDFNDCTISNSYSRGSDLSLKLRLELNSSGEWTADSHRSHRSHSSHRSHYSSSTGTTNKEAQTTNNSNLSSGSNSGVSSTLAPKAYNLGDRILYKGMKGADVTQLVNLLIKKKYLSLKDESTIATGIYEYDDLIINIVKQFQKDNAITVDGVVSSTTVYYLKK